MKVFKHGDSFALVIPDSLAKAEGLVEGKEYEFFLAEKGVFILASKDALTAKVKEGAYASLLAKLSSSSFQPASAVSTQAATASPASQIPLHIEFFVLQNDEEYMRRQKEIEARVKAGSLVGARGFIDKKFYFMDSISYHNLFQRISAILNVDSAAPAIAKALSVSEEACFVALQIAKDQGEVIERKRGVFALVK